MKHKHADLIHAWADGAVIQYWDEYMEEWCNHVPGTNPTWYVSQSYRIKPEEKKPVVRWLWAYKNGRFWTQLPTYATELEASMNELPLIKLEWSRTEFPE